MEFNSDSQFELGAQILLKQVHSSSGVGGDMDEEERTRTSSHIFVLVVSTLDQSRSTLVPDSRRPSCQTGTVDTRSKQVDTSPRFQKGRSTLDPVSSRTVLQKWDSRSTLDQGRSTHSG
ncbi:hypothetical protein Taro_033860 [Colocasia esculenta]|uniref:Uncharacterized protein n=1 Tax=Colocasia esculenta TaxID=4460 RepID=A0A843W5X6_COLES|nr:hypothetical protein [Colocasia esculenta]